MPANPYVDALAGNSFLEAGKDNLITYYIDQSGSRAWTAAEIAGIEAVFQSWANVANITFQRVFTAAAADITEQILSRTEMASRFGVGTTAEHSSPSSSASSNGHFSQTGESSTDPFNLDTHALTPSTYNFQVLLHEVGHGLGLAHPHDTGQGTTRFPGVFFYFDKGFFDLNQSIFTVMSYNLYGAGPSGANPDSGNAATPMAFDIAAIQSLYGANTTYQSGNTAYVLPTDRWISIWDTGGTDSVSYGGASDATIDLRPATLLTELGGGGFVSGINGSFTGGFTIANGVVIENANGGSGNDRLTGNDSANSLDGGAGNDTMTGGDGSDTFVVNSAGDAVVEGAGLGGDVDTVKSYISYILGTFLEDLVLLGTNAIDGTGNTLSNTITGNSAANVLSGGAGDDTIDGGGGTDTLVLSGLFDDYTFDPISLTQTSVTDNRALGEGFDKISNVEFIRFANETLSIDYVRNHGLTLVGTEGDDLLTGSNKNDTIKGLGGNDTLDGAGGSDILEGGNGDDIYFVDQPGDIVTELADQGTDEVRSAFSYQLGANVENLILLGAASISGFGNSLANTIVGNEKANYIDGRGGSDTIFAGDGPDEIYANLDSEAIDGGIGKDTVSYAGSDVGITVNLNLTTGQISGGYASGDVLINIENIRGSRHDDLITGNSSNNNIEDNGGNDAINGGDGDDTIWIYGRNTTIDGGTGDDYFFLNETGVAGKIVGGLGVDSLFVYGDLNTLQIEGVEYLYVGNIVTHSEAQSYATATAAVFSNFIGIRGGVNWPTDDIDLTLSSSGTVDFSNSVTTTGKLTVHGSTGADVIIGHAYADTLIGNTGADVLTGGSEADVFDFNSRSDSGTKATTRDVITDFQHGIDDVDLRTIDANTRVGGNQAYKFIGKQAFHHVAGELHYKFSGADTLVEGDSNGDGRADFQILLSGHIALAKGDFFL